MLDLRKRLERLSTDALSWRIGREEIGVARFERLELLVQRIVVCIRNLGRIVDVILPVVFFDLAAELRDARGRGRRHATAGIA